MRRSALLLILVLCLTAKGISQSLYYEPGLNIGHYTPFSAKHQYIYDYHQYGLQVRIGHQTNGEKQWQQEYAYPSYGILVGYTHNMLDSVIYYTHEGNQYGPVGHCFSLAGFVNGPFYRWKRWSFDYDIIYGADLWTRHGNEMLGSALNFHVSFDIGPTIRLSEQTDLVVRYLYYHSSNGATFLPDNGINSHLLRVGVRIHPQGRESFLPDHHEAFVKKNNLFISEGLGWLQTYTRVNGQLPDETPYFLGNTLRFGFARQFSPKFRWDAAVDFLWTGETRYRHELAGTPYQFWNSTHIAASSDFEIQFGRFAFCAGAAYYLYHGSEILPEFYTPHYERVGYKFYLGKDNRMFVGTFMKIHIPSIDYIEWTYGILF